MILYYLCLTLKRVLIRNGYKVIPKTGKLPKEMKHALFYFGRKYSHSTLPGSHYLLNAEFRANSGLKG